MNTLTDNSGVVEVFTIIDDLTVLLTFLRKSPTVRSQGDEVAAKSFVGWQN